MIGRLELQRGGGKERMRAISGEMKTARENKYENVVEIGGIFSIHQEEQPKVIHNEN